MRSVRADLHCMVVYGIIFIETDEEVMDMKAFVPYEKLGKKQKKELDPPAGRAGAT